MSLISKIPRGLLVLITMAILAILVWRLAAGTDFYYYAIGAAVLLTAAVVLAVYWHPTGSKKATAKKKGKKASAGEGDKEEPEASANDLEFGVQTSETIPIEKDYTDIPANQREVPTAAFQRAEVKPNAVDEAARYLQMATAKSAESAAENASGIGMDEKGDKTGTEEAPAEPPMPLIEDETTLTEEQKNELVNAVWYRCENPYCKYTQFLGVHHIIEEKDGGTNKLDNLIVFCPYCHDLAHRGEVPEEQMREWISNREERFKFKPNWPYFK